MPDPVIVEAAINGTTTKARNPNVPRLPDEIADDARQCLEHGASIVHNHIDVVAVPGEEAAARYVEGWAPVLAARPDALLYPTTNFGPGVEGAYLMWAALVVFALPTALGLLTSDNRYLLGSSAYLSAAQHAVIEEKLEKHPGQHLVLVSYGPHHEISR